MAASLRLLGYLALLTTGVVGVAVCPPEWRPRLMKPERSRKAVLLLNPSEETVILARRIKAKGRVVEKLRSGELSLFEAAAWFRHLNSEPASLPDHMWERFPGNDANEKLCQQVISWANGQLSTQATASEVYGLISRLEEELQRHLAERGKVELPSFDAE